MDGHHHRPTGEQQDNRVDRTHGAIQVMVRSHERFAVHGLHDAEAHKQAAEQKDFCDEEQPHADLAGIDLLLHVRKMMLQPGFVVLAVFIDSVCGWCHACVSVG